MRTGRWATARVRAAGRRTGGGTSRHEAWASAIMQRYDGRAVASGPSGLVHRLGRTADGAVIDRRQWHMHIARNWAPRLKLTLISHLHKNASSPQQMQQPVSGESVGPTMTWQLLRAHPEERPRPVSGRMASRPFVADAARLAAKGTRVDMVVARPGAHMAPQAGAASGAVAPQAATAMPVPVVFHTAARVAVAVAPAPAPRQERASWDATETFADERAATRRPATISLADDPALMGRITDTVMQQIDRRLQSYRERTGRA